MEKSPDAFRTISEVADWLGIQAHVLRFWESKFSQIKPVKRAGGRRYYRPSDMRLLGGIKKLLHDDGLTIKGVQKILREQGVSHVAAQSQSLEDFALSTAKPVTNVVRIEDAQTARTDAGAEAATDATGEQVAAAAPASEADAASEPEAAAPAPERTDLPRFMHQPATPEAKPAADAPEPGAAAPVAPEPEPAPAATPPRPRVIDAPDPPAEDQISARPGALAAIARLHRLSAAQAREIAPLAAELRSWLERTARSGAA